MAKPIQERWSCNENEAIRKRAYSGGEEDEVKACKILEWKNEVGKSRAGWVMINLTWLDHVEPVICRSRDYDITIVFPFRRELRRAYRCRYECSLVKNLSTHWKTGKENRETNENILALWGSWWVSKSHVADKKPPNLVATKEENRTKINQWKTF